MVKYLHLQILQ